MASFRNALKDVMQMVTAPVVTGTAPTVKTGMEKTAQDFDKAKKIETGKIYSSERLNQHEAEATKRQAKIDKQVKEGNPVINRYTKKVDKQKTNLKENKPIDLKTPMSSRYAWKDGEGGIDSDSGLFLPRQTKEAGMSKKEVEKEMDTASVESTAIKRIRYNPETGNLYITYKNGKKRNKEYVFPNVPKGAVTRLINSFSKGTYTAKTIKPRYAVSKEEALEAAKKDKK